MRASRLGFGALVALTIAGIAGCVSERASGPGVDLAACSANLPSEAFGSTIVIIRDFAFTPAAVHVRPGTKVTPPFSFKWQTSRSRFGRTAPIECTAT